MTEANPVVPVATVDDFARLVIDWFSDCQEQLGYAAQVPENVDIKATIDGVERSLTSTERQAFMAGVAVVGEIFKKLPFEAVPAPEGEEPNA